MIRRSRESFKAVTLTRQKGFYVELFCLGLGGKSDIGNMRLYPMRLSLSWIQVAW
jgi:hypothetical protein